MVKCEMPKFCGTATVGERGQIVIPAGVRKSYRIKAGDRLIVVAKSGGLIGLIPADQFNAVLGQMTELLSKITQEKPNND